MNRSVEPPASRAIHAMPAIRAIAACLSRCRLARFGPLVSLACLLGVIGAGAGCAHLSTVDHDALWKIVSLQCVPSMEQSGSPGNCAYVDLNKHYAVLKDIRGRSQHLLIPTDRVSGIESPAVRLTNPPDYWADAWDSLRFVTAAIHTALPDDLLGAEINSKFRRSQEQLHIHLDCMREDVAAQLAAHRADAPGQWRWVTLLGRRYRVMRVRRLTGVDDPFQIVGRDRQDSGQMATQTILVTGAGPSAARDGWLVVNSGLDLKDGSGTAEGLLDHACRVADGR